MKFNSNKKRFNKKYNKKYNDESFYKCKYKNPRPQKLYNTNRWRKPTQNEIEVKKTLTANCYSSFCHSWHDFISKMFNRYMNERKSYYFWMNKFYNYKVIQYRAFINSKNSDYDDDDFNNYVGAIMATLYKIKDKNSSGKDENSIPNYLTIEELNVRVQKIIFNFIKKYWHHYIYRKVLE